MPTTPTHPEADRVNDAVWAILDYAGASVPTAAVDKLADDITHEILARIESAARPSLLARLEVDFHAQGGRGVDLADEIDALRHQRTLVIQVPITLTEPGVEPVAMDVAQGITDNLGDEWFDDDGGDDWGIIDRDRPMVAEVR